MPKYWEKNYFAHGSFPEVGQKQKTEKKKKEKKEREKERLNNDDNNGQATHSARKYAWRTQAAWANNGQLCIANATSSGAHMPTVPSSLCIL